MNCKMNRESISENQEFEHILSEALSTTAEALKSIEALYGVSDAAGFAYWGNIEAAKRSAEDAMVNLAIASSPEDIEGTRRLLNDYGSHDLI